MSGPLLAFLDAYAEALRRHLDSPTHDTLSEGYELGRRALVEGISLLDLTEHHFRLAAEAERAATAAGAPDARIAESALEFLLQTLAALDIATRGYLDGTRRYEQQRSRADDLAGRDAFRTALVESLQDGFFVATADGTVIEVNAAFGALTGYGAAGVPYPLPHPWSLPEGGGYPNLSTEVPRLVLPIRHRDGRRLFLSVSTSALVKPENNELIYVGTIRDVTAEHAAQERDQAANRLVTAVGAATSVMEVLSVGLDELRHTVDAESAVVMVWPTRHGAPEVYISGKVPEADSGSAREADSGSAFPADSGSAATRRLLERARKRPPRSLSAVPEGADSSEGIVAPLGETGDAALYLRFAPPRAINSADWTLFSLLIGHLSVAVQRARNFDQARATSLTLQRAMLGPIELPPRFSVHYEPALPPLEIGGDWYDVVPLRDGTIGVIVGDCVGRGLSAAVVMGQLRTAGRALLLRGAGPAQLLAELDAVASRIPGAMCTTACAAVLDPARGVVRYSNAGHMPLILAEAGKPGRRLDGGRAVPLATFELTRRPEATTALAPGSTLVLFTDGLVERRGVDIDDSFARICAVLADQSEKLPREVADAVLRELSPDAGYDDDVAMVVYRQPPAPLHLDLPAEAGLLSGLRRTLRSWLWAAAVPHELASDLVAAANEACTNSVEHAYPAGGTSPRVELNAYTRHEPGSESGAEKLVIEVFDTGVWRPRSADPGNRGRGIDMMRALTDELEIDHSDTGTRVRMSVTLPATVKSPVANPLRGTDLTVG
ncbi:SpoIIE family protein phosphatase [Nocardia higoensis]|uniref:SpoIIE family protein phosphatase n=1 Tax=Nocardia higoensis TaxID=228599 RepID=A0ABS0D6W0_9NOCA|nr:SpoIIE family protein phosphatase [Nocardia higoensis]MBF6354101.1 SpoIIE family protein phosphatase [Nocardia higoensis]